MYITEVFYKLYPVSYKGYKNIKLFLTAAQKSLDTFLYVSENCWKCIFNYGMRFALI